MSTLLLLLQPVLRKVCAFSARKRYAYATLFGLLTTLALPPLHVFPLLFITLPGVLWLVQSAHNKKSAFFTGWWFGFGHWVVGIYWMAFSLLTEADKFWWLVPLAVFGLSGILGLYVGLASLAYYALNRSPFQKLLLFASLWVLGELFRAQFLLFVTLYGFPWSLIGYVWSFSDSMIQLASIGGIYGLSFITLLCCGSPVLLASIQGRAKLPLMQEHGMRYVVPLILLLPLIGVFGTVRLMGANSDTVPDVTLRLVQANVPEHHQWDPVKREALVDKHVALSTEPGLEKVSAVIWSESSFPYLTDQEGWMIDRLLPAVPKDGLLFTGAMRMEFEGAGESTKPELYSTLNAIDEHGNITGFYDKYRLVPFGEYIPWRRYIPFLDTVVGGTDFSTGTGPKTLDVPGLPSVSPLICYDVIFPQSVVDPTKRPGWMLNITNDAWFEKRIHLFGYDGQLSTGPYQHFAMAKMRAVEQGIPLIRVANTGISAVIDPYGRVKQELRLAQESVLDVALPRPADQLTPYARLGNILILALVAPCVLFALYYRKNRNS
jgi:apolipoprotein N-acyltransferase